MTAALIVVSSVALTLAGVLVGLVVAYRRSLLDYVAASEDRMLAKVGEDQANARAAQAEAERDAALAVAEVERAAARAADERELANVAKQAAATTDPAGLMDRVRGAVEKLPDAAPSGDPGGPAPKPAVSPRAAAGSKAARGK